MSNIQQMRVKIFEELSKIVDPEINVSIMELQLVDNVEIRDGNVKVELHLTSPFCPAVFGFKIAQDIRDNLKKIEGVKDVKVYVSNHFMAEVINKQVNEGSSTSIYGK
jgi:metal-sulfur cluster biosynthetic enzyme